MLTPKDVQNILSYLQNINSNVKINTSELNKRLKSHPSYPSLLSIVDVISDVGFKSAGYELNSSNFESLPHLFLAQIKNSEYGTNEMVLVKKEHNLLFFDGEQINSEEFLQLSTGVFILVELKNTTLRNNSILFGVILLLGLSLFLYDFTFFSYFILLSLPLIGLFMSFYFFESLFNIRIDILNKICYKSEISSCKTISSSKKWKVFNYINFSDLGLVFFFTQILTFLSLFLNVTLGFIVEIYLMCGFVIIPTLALSIFYQSFVEKNWCRICLLIALNLVIQLAVAFYLYSLLGYPNFKYYPFITFSIIYVIVFTIWSLFKKTLQKNQKLTDLNEYLTDIVNDYNTFKAVLLLNKQKDKNICNNEYLFSFGSNDDALNITVITDPFCKYCKSTNKMIRTILENYSQNLNINFLFNVDLADENINYYRLITDSYLMNKKESFFDFICNKHNTDIINDNINFSDLVKIDEYLLSQSKLCDNNEISYFPTVLIKGYEYPLKYDIKMLENFIPQLILDKNNL